MKEQRECVASGAVLWWGRNKPVCQRVHRSAYKPKVKVHVVGEIRTNVWISPSQEAVEHGTTHADDHCSHTQDKEEQTGVFTRIICPLTKYIIWHTQIITWSQNTTINIIPLSKEASDSLKRTLNLEEFLCGYGLTGLDSSLFFKIEMRPLEGKVYNKNKSRVNTLHP